MKSTFYLYFDNSNCHLGEITLFSKLSCAKFIFRSKSIWGVRLIPSDYAFPQVSSISCIPKSASNMEKKNGTRAKV